MSHVFISPNVTGQGTRHLVAGTLDPIVRLGFSSLVFYRINLIITARITVAAPIDPKIHTKCI